jgi:hypothetical protein
MPLAHVAIAIEGAGWTNPDNIALMVANTMIGSWDKSMGGGPHNANRIARFGPEEGGPYCTSFQAFNTCYKVKIMDCLLICRLRHLALNIMLTLISVCLGHRPLGRVLRDRQHEPGTNDGQHSA